MLLAIKPGHATRRRKLPQARPRGQRLRDLDRRRARPGSSGGKLVQLFRAARMWRYGGPIQYPQRTGKETENQ
jgi:hypothetical protein